MEEFPEPWVRTLLSPPLTPRSQSRDIQSGIFPAYHLAITLYRKEDRASAERSAHFGGDQIFHPELLGLHAGERYSARVGVGPRGFIQPGTVGPNHIAVQVRCCEDGCNTRTGLIALGDNPENYMLRHCTGCDDEEGRGMEYPHYPCPAHIMFVGNWQHPGPNIYCVHCIQHAPYLLGMRHLPHRFRQRNGETDLTFRMHPDPLPQNLPQIKYVRNLGEESTPLILMEQLAQIENGYRRNDDSDEDIEPLGLVFEF